MARIATLLFVVLGLVAPGRTRAQAPDAATPAPAPAPAPTNAADAGVPDAALPEAQATFHAPLALFAAGWPVLGGELSGTATITCAWTSERDGIHRLCNLVSEEALLHGEPLGRLEAAVDIPARGAVVITALLRGPMVKELQFSFRGALQLNIQTGGLAWTDDVVNAEIHARGLNGAVITQLLPTAGLDGVVDLDVVVSGLRKNPKIDARFSSDGLSWHGMPALPVSGTWNHFQNVSQLVMDGGAAPGTSFHLAARLPVTMDFTKDTDRVTWVETGDHDVALSATGLNARFIKPFTELPKGVEANLALTATAKGSLAGLAVDAKVTGNLSLTPTLVVPVTMTFEGRGAAQRVELSAGNLLSAKMKTTLSWPAFRKDPKTFAHAPLDGTVAIHARLEDIAAYLPEGLASPTGSVAGDVRVGGTVEKPTFTGTIASQRAAITVTDLNQRLAPLDLAVTFAGNTATIRTLRAQAGAGTITGKGAFTIGQASDTQATVTASSLFGWTVAGTMSLALKDFPIVQPSIPLGTLNTTLDLSLSQGPDMVSVELIWHHPKVVLTDQELAEARAIPANRNVRVLDWLGQTSEQDELFGGHATGARLKITLADPLDVRGAKFAMVLTGEMEVIRKGLVVTVDGGFETKKGGQFQLFDNPFTVRSGRLTLVAGQLGRHGPGDAFDGTDMESNESTVTVEVQDPDRPVEARPLDPMVDFTGEGIVEDTLVVVQVRGPATRPELVLVSNPPLPEYQIVTLLITGRVDAVDESKGQVRREVAKLTDRFHNPSLQRQLFDRLGVDKIGLGFGSSVTEPILTVGKQISRRVYVETIYHHNAPPEENTTAGRVQYRLNPWWTVDTTVGDAGNGNLGVFWGTRFGGPPPPGPEALAKLGTKPPADRDGDGIPDTTDQCLDEPEDKDDFEDSDGCPDPDNDHDGVPDVKDQAPLIAETRNGFEDDDGVPDATPAAMTDLTFVVAPFTFRANDTTPRMKNSVLRAFAAMLQDLGETHYDLVGYSDDKGGAGTNMRLSVRRAEAVRDLLFQRGVPKRLFTVVGLGNGSPLDTDSTAAAHARNRRVEIRATAPAPAETPDTAPAPAAPPAPPPTATESSPEPLPEVQEEAPTEDTAEPGDVPAAPTTTPDAGAP